MTSGTLRAILLAGACALSLAACATPSALTPSQTLEQADTAASLAYAATATALNAYEAANPSGVTKAETIKTQAWDALQQERALYAKGQDVSAVLAQLQTLETQAKAL